MKNQKKSGNYFGKNFNGMQSALQQKLDMNTSEAYDRVSVTDWTIDTNRAGKKFFVYLYFGPRDIIRPVVSDNGILPNNGETPNFFTPENTRLAASMQF